MKYGVIITWAPVLEQVEMARAAEEAGWDGVFTWDGIYLGDDHECHDPWVLMAAFAMATKRVRLGAIIMPLARRRPWKVVRETVTLDHLSNGRLILPVGLGAEADSAVIKLEASPERRVRAERLDETLEILQGLWSGEPFGYEGRHYRFEPMAFTPRPIQRPRIPIWVVGLQGSDRSMSRVLRYDGLLLNTPGGPGSTKPEDIAEMRAWLAERRTLEGFDILAEGVTPGDDKAAAAALVRPWREAGATWWIEADWMNKDVDALRHRIEAGPPRE